MENNAARKIQQAWRARTVSGPSAKNKFELFNLFRGRKFPLEIGSPFRNYTHTFRTIPKKHWNYVITPRDVQIYGGEQQRRYYKQLEKQLNAISNRHRKPATLAYRATPRPAYNFESHLKNASPGRAGYYMKSPPRTLTMKQLAERALTRTRQKRSMLGLTGANKSVRNMMAEKLVREKWLTPYLARRFTEHMKA